MKPVFENTKNIVLVFSESGVFFFFFVFSMFFIAKQN